MASIMHTFCTSTYELDWNAHFCIHNFAVDSSWGIHSQSPSRAKVSDPREQLLGCL